MPQVASLSFLCWAALFLSWAASASRQAQEEAGLNHDENLGSVGADLGCYCKAVNFASECPDNKYPEESKRPDGPRFLHSPGYLECCKRESLSMSNRMFGVGWHWKLQPAEMMEEKCYKEVAYLPSTSCCVLSDSTGSVAVRVSTANAEVYETVKIVWVEGSFKTIAQYYKTSATISIDDITTSNDWDDRPVIGKDAQDFVAALVKAGRFPNQPSPGRLACQSNIRDLVAEQFDSQRCRLRQQATHECCCQEEEVKDVKRCIPLADAPQDRPLLDGPQEVFAKVTERTEHSCVETIVEPGLAPALPQTLPRLLTMVDPEADRSAAGGERLWDWQLVADQWRPPKPSKTATVKTIQHTQTCSEGNPPPKCSYTKSHTKVRGTGKLRSLHTVTTNHNGIVHNHYSQAYKEAVISYVWERKCPAGTVRYQRVIPKGACMGEAELQRSGLFFSCPAGHVSSRPFAISPYNSGCTCDAGTECRRDVAADPRED